MSAGRVPSARGGGSLVSPITIDSSANAAAVPLTIITGKNQSTYVAQAGGAAISPAYALNDNSGVLKGVMGLAMTSGDFVTGSTAGQFTITAATYVYIRGQASGVKLVSNSGNGLVMTDDSIGSRIAWGSTSVSVDGSGVTLVGNSLPTTFATGTVATTAGTSRAIQVTGTFAPTSGSGIYRMIDGSYTINQTGGANGTVTGIYLNATETAVVGTHNLLDLQIAATSMFTVDNKGGFQCASAALVTTATAGLPRLRTCAGAPTGAVADGSFMIDTTNSKLWARVGGAWKGVVIA